MLKKKNQIVERKELVISLNSTLQSIGKKVFKIFNHKQIMSLSNMSKKLGCSRPTIRS